MRELMKTNTDKQKKKRELQTGRLQFLVVSVPRALDVHVHTVHWLHRARSNQYTSLLPYVNTEEAARHSLSPYQLALHPISQHLMKSSNHQTLTRIERIPSSYLRNRAYRLLSNHAVP